MPDEELEELEDFEDFEDFDPELDLILELQEIQEDCISFVHDGVCYNEFPMSEAEKIIGFSGVRKIVEEQESVK